MMVIARVWRVERINQARAMMGKEQACDDQNGQDR